MKFDTLGNMASLRTDEGAQKYRKYRKNNGSSGLCDLCEKASVEQFKCWKIIENSFPYDRIAQTHHMLIPLRHVPEQELHQDELEELSDIKHSFVNQEYDWIIEATSKNQTVPDHFHLHLVVGKDT